jgi:pyrroloquinoline quinone (PQQ) biosynthesis protein C
MPEKYVAEMVADRIAASKIYKKDKYTDSSALEYYMSKRDYHVLHPETKALLEKLLIMLSKKGEDYTFAYIRHRVLKKK